ncbi:vacuolar protein 14 C-terminal Fig4p binding-domain-containing protein [Glomus cerebriforme]|uniref:Vacuolar protein 14 C-terminal Fig4p binding-domain-containing protein n=1 Tax=Glomus cerebriforme TaxID=658196 RepID=A0A397T1U9_9GLOM|nr:vacuolar protein 14 C-terminal Fig4p binding-domain-containing protein [Glomus cerebriforme]
MSDVLVLSAQIVRGLNDKAYEKRKAAALEVEKLIREYSANKESERVRAILDKLVQDFAYSVNPNARNGGLIGLAAASIALGPDVAAYLEEIVPPVLACFADQDSRVRYYACESMYNIAKVSKGEILRYFNEVFDAMSKLAADSELSVKNGAELLDRLIKDIVAEQSTTYVSILAHPSLSHDDSMGPVSMPRTTAFSLPRFIPLLSERIRAKNPFTRNFLVSWITVLDSIPDLELVSFLPDFLDGLLQFLSDPNDVKYATSTVLANFLAEIREAVEVKEHQKQQSMKTYFVEQQQKLSETASDAGESIKEGDGDDATLVKSSINSSDGDINWDTVSISETEGRGKGSWVPGQGVVINYTRIVEILMPHLSSHEEEIQATALKWINEFISLAKDVIIVFTPQLISAVLPSLAHSVAPIRTVAVEVNRNLYKLILETPTNTVPSLQSPPYSSAHLSSISPVDSSVLLMHMGINKEHNSINTLPLIYEQADPFDYQETVKALVHQFKNEHEETRVASLDWLLMLHKKAPKKILAIDDGTFPVLLKTLSDLSEEVVRRDLQLLAQLSSSSEDEFFTRFMVDLLKLFSTDRRLLESRGSLIIRHLCSSLNSERIYRTFAEILEREEDIEFASNMVQNLNSILITTPELSDLRKRLKNLETKDGQMLFTALYKSWCHNPVSTFSLCLLAQAYEHAANLLQSFADLDITVNLLIQIDKLVQLIESPVFTYLRLQLLEPEKYPYLFKCLYGLLMLLPQSSAFASLKNRLTSVSSMGFLHLIPKSTPTADTKRSTTKAIPTKEDGIKFQDLLAHFRAVQTKHEKTRKQALQSGHSNSQLARNRRGRDRDRDHRDKSTFPSQQTSNLSPSTHLSTSKYIGNNAHSSDHKGGSGTSGVPTNQPKRRLSAASNASATSDHGGNSSSRPQSPPINGSRRGVMYRK